jgi:acyl-CoA reductase-like NAD-dependent aldehyde dehydrogenase
MSSLPVTPMRIGPDRVDHGPGNDAVIVVRSPYDAHEVGRVPLGTESDIDAAVAAAVECQRGEPLPAHERAAILDRAAAILETDEQRERFARLIAEEAAKPIKTARIEAARAVDTFRFAAATARTLTGELVPLDASSAGEGKIGLVLRVPVGVVAAISPFNFPLNLVAHKVAPAIAAGCAVVLKPASATPLTALALAEVLLDRCGLPSGWLNVVTCRGATAEHLVTHPDVALVTFTGSAEVGWGIKARAPRKKVGLELGNNTPVIVEPDADLDEVAHKISVAGYSHAGQSCISVQRVYVHESVLDTFVTKLVNHVDALQVGDPLDEATDVSALITEGETERVERAIREAVGGGARIACGGRRDANGVLLPTVLVGVVPEMTVCHTEIFGPVVGVQPYSTFAEALRLANNTRYGLQAGVFTRDLDKALRAARSLDFGGVTINEVPTWRADQMPYGGRRDSGNTREGPAYSAVEMTEPRLVVITAPSS